MSLQISVSSQSKVRGLHSRSVSIAAVVAVAQICSGVAYAQQSLPGIVVEGATLEQKAVRARPAQPASVPQASGTLPKSVSAAKSQTKSAPQAPVTQSASASTSDDAAGQGGGATQVAGIPLREIGTAVTVISRDEIERSKAQTFADVVRAQPGVTVTQQGTAGTLTQVRLRGEDGKYTRVIVDGVDVSTTKDGAFDFSMLGADEIERVEIIRGPMSALYGSGAMGGVINVVTKAPRGPLGGLLVVEGGSFGTKRISGRVGGGGETSYLSISGGFSDQAGYNISPFGREKDGTRLATIGLKGGVSLSSDARLDVVVRHTEKRSEYDDFGADFVTPPATKPFQTADDAANVLRQRQTLAGVRLAWDSFDGVLTQTLKANYSRDNQRNRFEPLAGTPWFFPPATVNNSIDESTRLTYGYGITYRVPGFSFGRHTLSGQIERETETFTPFSDWPTFFGDYNGDGIERTRNRLSFAGEWRGVFADRLALTAGVRRDDNDTFQDFTTWRAAASYDWKELGLRPHASVGTGAKLPGMYDQYGANSTTYQSNPDLRPETSFGYDAGIEQRFFGGRLVIDTTYFNTRLEDRIALNGFDPVTFRSFPINIAGTSRRQGVELSAIYQIDRQWTLGLAYTYTDARTPDGAKEWRRVPHGLRASIGYTSLDGRGTVNLAAIYNSRTPDVVFANPTFARSTLELEDYWLVQLAGSYKLSDSVELYGRLENVLDRKYQEVYGYQAPGFGAYAGLKVRFGGETKR